MHLDATVASAAGPALRGDAPAQLRGRGRIVARAALAAVAALALVLFVVTVPARYTQLRTLAETGLGDGWTAAEARAALTQLGLPVAVYAASISALDILFVSAFFTVAAVLAWRKSDEWMALFVAIFLVSFGVNWTTDAAWWAGTAWHTPITVLDTIAWASFIGFFFLFPDGRFVPRWTRPLAIGWIAGMLISNFFLPLPDWVVLLLWLSALGLCLFAQIYRYRRVSGPVPRQQTKWVVFGFAVSFALSLGLVVTSVLFPSLNQPSLAGLLYQITGRLLSYLLFLPIPLAIGIAVLRYRLWEIDLIINRTLVYSALTAAISGIYVLVVGALGTLFQARGNLLIALFGAGLVAVLFQPLHVRLQRSVNRLLYGERDDPYAVLSRLGRRLEATLAPNAVLPGIVETVKDALKLPYVAIALLNDERGTMNDESPDSSFIAHHSSFEIAAAAGMPVDNLLRIPLVYQTESVGALLLGLRAPSEPFSPADRRLLDDIANQAGVAAHALRLTADLQRSRERLVAAREEERRRLRRDLHDGLGPALATQTLKLEAARDLIAGDPARAADLLSSLIVDSQTAIADIRRLVYALRPPALDDLGLVSAVREQVAQCANDQLAIAIDAPDRLPPLPAAVEVAAYRIVQEALTNVVKHARAHACTIQIALVGDGPHRTLALEVRDDGIGLPARPRQGVGLHSMRERAEELGGVFVMASGHGTRISAYLPAPQTQEG